MGREMILVTKTSEHEMHLTQLSDHLQRKGPPHASTPSPQETRRLAAQLRKQKASFDLWRGKGWPHGPCRSRNNWRQ